MLGWVKLALGAIGLGGDYLEGKQRLKQTKLEGEISITKKKAEHIDTWEQTHAQGSQTSWKDEFWTLVWSVPVIMAFIPGGAKYALAGFDALMMMPEWYTYTLMTIVLAAFGIRLTGAVKAKLDDWRDRPKG
jgi:hypothetical protein